MPSRRLFATLAALAAGVVLADIGVGSWMLENGVYKGQPLPPFGRLTEPRRVWLAEQEAVVARGKAPTPLQGFDAELGWSNRPGKVKRKFELTINSVGARGAREYPERPAEDVVRAICYGESFTYGSQVADGDAWSAQLEARDPGLELINLGVGGFGADQALLRFRRVGSMHAQVAIMGIMLESIGRNVNRLPALYYPPTAHLYAKPRFVLEDGSLRLVPQPFPSRREALDAAREGRLLEAVKEHEYWTGDDPLIPFSTILRVRAAEPAYARRQKRGMWLDVDGEPYRVTMAVLEAFHREALASGAEHTLVMIFPAKGDLGRLRNGRPPFWTTLHDGLRERGIPYLDFGEVFASMPKVERLYVSPHLNRRGNEVVAETVQAWIRERYPR